MHSYSLYTEEYTVLYNNYALTLPSLHIKVY